MSSDKVPNSWSEFMDKADLNIRLVNFFNRISNIHVVPSEEWEEILACATLSAANLRYVRSEIQRYMAALDPMDSKLTVDYGQKAVDAVTKALLWWDEYQAGSGVTYLERAYLERANRKRVGFTPSDDKVTLEAVTDPYDDNVEVVCLGREQDEWDLCGLLTPEDLDGSKVPPPPTLDEVADICWERQQIQKFVGHYWTSLKNRMEKVAEDDVGDEAGAHSGINGWRQFVTPKANLP